MPNIKDAAAEFLACKRVEIRGMEYVQVRDGKIVIDNLYYDNVALLAQLGLVPPGATA